MVPLHSCVSDVETLDLKAQPQLDGRDGLGMQETKEKTRQGESESNWLSIVDKANSRDKLNGGS